MSREMRKLTIKNYGVKYATLHQNDDISMEYAFLWVKTPNVIENPLEFPVEDIKTIKEILKRHNIFEFKINLNL